MFQTFKPTILQDSTSQFRNSHFTQGTRQTVKMQKNSEIDLTKDAVDYKQRCLDLLEELEEQRNVIEGQNQYIQIMRNSIEQKLKNEDLQSIINQLQDMSREQQMDMFTLVSQLYSELKYQNENNEQLSNLQQTNDNLNQQIKCYVQELMDQKIEKQYLIDQLNEKQQISKYINNSSLQEDNLQLENEQLRKRLNIIEKQFDQLSDEKIILEKKLNKIHMNLRTEECEKEELLKEYDQMKQQYYKSQAQEVHKLELDICLKQQELEFVQNKLKKIEKQMNEINDLNEELSTQNGQLKSQIESLHKTHQLQINQTESDIESLQQKINETEQYCIQLKKENELQDEYINQSLIELQKIVGNKEEDIFQMIIQIQEKLNIQQEDHQMNDQDKCKIIFDLQCQLNDSENNNQKQNDQIQKLETQIKQFQQNIRQMEKNKKIFKSEYNHLLQLNQQKKEEIEEIHLQYKKIDKRLQQELEININLDKEVNTLKEQLLIQQQHANSLKQQLSSKKSLSFSHSFVEQKYVKSEYQALLQTFEKIKPLFKPDALELVQEMLEIQNKLVNDSVDSQTLQEELKIQQKIQLYQLNIMNEEKPLQRHNKQQSLSVHFKPRIQQ